MSKYENKTTPSIAVIGSGYWGKNLVRSFSRLGALNIVCDKNETLLSELKKKYPEIEVCVALNDVLRRDSIEAVAIATPAETHYALVREALLSDKHVFVEKPLVLDENEAEELIDIASKRELVLMVGHLLQYHPAYVRLKKLASQGELGRINYIYSNRLNLGKIRREENALWSFAPHDISMILTLAGEKPESVQTTGGNYLHKKIADVTTTHLEFPSGLKAHIFVSWLHPYKEQKLVVVGDKKMAVFNDTKPWKEKLQLFAHRIVWNKNIPIPDKAEPENIEIPNNEPLLQECEHFLKCIQTDDIPLTDGREGLDVLRILNASQRSLESDGEKVVLTQKTDGETEIKDSLTVEHFVHPTAIVDNGVTIGKNTKIWHFSHILSGSNVGERCNIGQNVVIGPDVSIGKGCKIQNNVSVYKGVILEDGVFCGPSMVFTNVLNPRAEIRKMDQVRPTVVKKGATIGANATIVCGTTIGKFALIGAGAVVTKNIPDHALVVGNPARQIGWVCECGGTLDMKFFCKDCGKEHSQLSQGN